ncbi:MAG: DUF6814 family protein [Saprospiraceae bacterium]
MNQIKRLTGILWMILGPAAIYMMLNGVLKILAIADTKIAKATTDAARAAAISAKNNTTLQWGIMIAIFIPIMIGLVIFGYYAFKGEYDIESE